MATWWTGGTADGIYQVLVRNNSDRSVPEEWGTAVPAENCTDCTAGGTVVGTQYIE
jgi:hypothetical protein